MAGIDNNLYPPIFNKSIVPAFIYNQPCRIYFSISHFNSIDEVDQNLVQVSIKNQKTNQSVFTQKYAPCGIQLALLKEDSSVAGADRYYVEINNTSFQRGELELNQYYQVQLRFTQAGKVARPSKGIVTAAWLNANLPFFSEWSRTILIRGIDFPIIELDGFNNMTYFHSIGGNETDTSLQIWKDSFKTYTGTNFVEVSSLDEDDDNTSSDDQPSVDVAEYNITKFAVFEPNIHGTVSFASSEETEKIESYRLILRNYTGQIIEDSDNIFPNAFTETNEISYIIRSDLQYNSLYTLQVSILTENEFKISRFYYFMLEDNYLYNIDNRLLLSTDNLNGRVRITIDSPSLMARTLNEAYVITRSSSEENFKFWDTIYEISVDPDFIFPVSFYDNTPEPGVYYRYRLQKVDSYGFRSNFVNADSPVMIEPEDCYLYGEGRALRIRFDPKVTNFSHTVSETKVETIGSKYPFIYRNANINYKTFTISGLIISLMDPMNMFHASRIDIYKDNWERYENYNYTNNIDVMHDYIYEKKFRDEVIDFLYENTVKLFKSTTEGNVLVKLSNISFEPKNELGRFIYSFSATAYEVADAKKLENYFLYNIQDKGGFNFLSSYSIDRYGQYYLPENTIIYTKPVMGRNNTITETKLTRTAGNGQYFNKKVNVISLIEKKYSKAYPSSYIVKVPYLKYLKIEMTSKPYLIGEKDGILQKISLNSTTQDTSKILTKGYLVILNGERIVIKEHGIYELIDFSMKIKSIIFPYDDAAALSYVARLQLEDQPTSIIVKAERQKCIGQYWGAASAGRSFWNWINKKYKMTTYSKKKKASEQRVDKIHGVRIYANPGTVFSVAENQDLTGENIIINETGMLEFYDQNTDISSIIYDGIRLNIYYPTDQEKQAGKTPKDYKINYTKQCILTNENVTDLYRIENPIENGVYNLIRDPYNKVLRIPSNLMAIEKIKETVSDYYLDSYYLNENTRGAITDATVASPYKKMLKLYGLGYSIANVDQLDSMYFIYYEKDWYPVTIYNNICILGIDSTEVVVDYFCDIVKEWYKV